MRKSAIALISGAVVAGVAAGAIRFVLVPSQEQVQSSTNQVEHYAGTATFLDQTKVASGDLANAFASDVPFTADETYKTMSLHGGTAVMSDTTATAGPAAPVLGSGTAIWAVDRKTLLPATAPAGSNALPHQGLVVGFAFGPEKKDYPWWDSATESQATAKYTGSEQHAGVSTYVYEVDAVGPAKAQSIVAKLPTTIPQLVLKGLAQQLGGAQAAALGLVLPKDGSDVALAYVAETKTKTWIEQTTGETIESQQTETVTAQMKTPVGVVPLTSVLTVKLDSTPAGVAADAKKAKDDNSKLLWVGTVLPAALGLLALVLLVLGVMTGRRKPAAVAVGAPVTEAAESTADEDSESSTSA
jgi:hypothetical protein